MGYGLNGLIKWFSGGDEGVTPVNPNSMLGLSGVWYAMNKISGMIGQMPLEIKRKLSGGGAEDATNHAAWRLLRWEPNVYQTADVFKETLQGHALGWGNGRAVIIRQGNRPVELLPLRPDRTRAFMVAGEKYHVTNPVMSDDAIAAYAGNFEEAMTANPETTIVIHDRDVLHIQGFGYDGIEGKGVAQVARESISMGLNAQRLATKQSEKGFTGRLMLQAPPGTFRQEKDAAEFLTTFRKHHNEDGELVGLLREGVTANVLTMSNHDAQFVEQQKFNRTDIMLWFGLESMPGDESRSSYSSLEQKQLAELQSCLNRWLVKWEMQCRAKLLSLSEQRADSHYFKFNRQTLIMTDTQTTINSLAQGIMNKILSPNEARAKLDMNPYDGGDNYSNPMIDPTITNPETGEAELPDRSGDMGNDDDADEAAASAARAQLQHMVGVECNRIRDRGLKAKNFCEWVDAFYDRWQERLEATVGAEDCDVAGYCQLHKQALLAAADHKPEQFEAAVLALIDQWRQDGVAELVKL
jgi:HK97 family phage portal protein